VHSFLLDGKLGPKAGLKVLVVDSDPKSVQELGVALRDRGCEPLEATSFEAAKQLWIAEKPPALIADVRLGQFNGLQLLLRAKADRPDVAAVITCAFPDKVLEAETQRFGGTFMVKPLTPEEVLAHLLGPNEPVTLERFGERRTGDRRLNIIGGFLPDRRQAARRRSSRD
jgi:DNA-binding NtrC family response regulator